MFLLKRLSPYLIALLEICVLEIILKKPQFVFWLAPILVVVVLFLIWFLAFKPLGFKVATRFVLTGFLLQAGLIASLLFLEKQDVRQILILVGALLLALQQEYVFRFVYRPEKYRAYSLENLSSSINLLIFLWISLAIFGFLAFMNLSFWWALLLLVFLTGVCLVLFFRGIKIEMVQAKMYLIGVMVLVLEFFVILFWLPFNFYLKALFLTTLYYLLTDLSRHLISDTANKKNVLWPIVICGVLWILLFVTARWI